MTQRKSEDASIKTNDYTLHAGDFEKLLLEAIYESFSSLGESAKRSIYFRLEKSFSIKKELIPNRIVAFAQAIEKIFGPGADLLEISIMKKLHRKSPHNRLFHCMITIRDQNGLHFKSHCVRHGEVLIAG